MESLEPPYGELRKSSARRHAALARSIRSRVTSTWGTLNQRSALALTFGGVAAVAMVAGLVALLPRAPRSCRAPVVERRLLSCASIAAGRGITLGDSISRMRGAPRADLATIRRRALPMTSTGPGYATIGYGVCAGADRRAGAAPCELHVIGVRVLEKAIAGLPPRRCRAPSFSTCAATRRPAAQAVTTADAFLSEGTSSRSASDTGNRASCQANAAGAAAGVHGGAGGRRAASAA